jgi:hypothetical protein
MAISPTAVPAGEPPIAADTFKDLLGVDTSPGPGASRMALFAALQGLGVDPVTDGDLHAMATTPGLDFADEPLEVAA